MDLLSSVWRKASQESLDLTALLEAGLDAYSKKRKSKQPVEKPNGRWNGFLLLEACQRKKSTIELMRKCRKTKGYESY